MSSRQLLIGIMLVAGTMALSALAGESEIKVSGAWVREAPPTARVLAAYMTIANLSARARSIVGAESPAFERVEIHRTVVSEGVARMVRQEKLELPSEGRVELAPGGYHLMLMKAKQPLKSGDSIDIIFIFADGTRLAVKAPVKKAPDL